MSTIGNKIKYQKFSSICLIAGTAIGAGTIALPMTLIKIGIFYSFILMIAVWFIAYYSSLVSLEINLRAGEGLSLGQLGKKFSGRTAYFLGDIALILLCYTLLSAYIYAGSSTIITLLDFFNLKAARLTVSTAFCFVIITILISRLKIINKINNILFIIMMLIFAIFLVTLYCKIDLVDALYLKSDELSFSSIYQVLPVLFTSFGFQVVFHTLTNFCHKDSKKLKFVFFWGSLIPVILYMLWTAIVLIVLYYQDIETYSQMILGKVEVGDFIKRLSLASQVSTAKVMIWMISLLVIITSIIGVSKGLYDAIDSRIKSGTSLVVVIPSYMIATFIPNAFIKGLGFAGLILVFIAIFLPSYLYFKSRHLDNYYQITKNIFLHGLFLLSGLSIVIAEIYTIFYF